MVEGAVRNQALKSALDREERRDEKARIYVGDLRTEIYECCEEAAHIHRLAEEAWDTSEWLKDIREVLEEHLDL